MGRVKHGPNVYKKRDPECVCFALRPVKKVENPVSELREDVVDAIASEDKTEVAEEKQLVVANTISVSPSARASVLHEVVKAPEFNGTVVGAAIQNDRSDPYEGFMDIDAPETQSLCDTRIEASINATSDKSQQAVLENNENPDSLEVDALIVQQLRHTQDTSKDESISSCLSSPDVPLMLDSQSRVACRDLAAAAPPTTPTKPPNLTHEEARKLQEVRAKERQASGSYKNSLRRSKRSEQKAARKAAQHFHDPFVADVPKSALRGKKRSGADVGTSHNKRQKIDPSTPTKKSISQTKATDMTFKSLIEPASKQDTPTTDRINSVHSMKLPMLANHQRLALDKRHQSSPTGIGNNNRGRGHGRPTYSAKTPVQYKRTIDCMGSPTIERLSWNDEAGGFV